MDNDRHKQRQQKLKQRVDERIAAANEVRGILMVFTGNGKGKTTAVFGTATRAVGHGMRVGVIQFIKGEWPNGERNLLAEHGVAFQVMATGFTWDTQAAQAVWQHGKRMLADATLDLVILDELTYMVSYDYLALEEVVTALQQRLPHQNVIITGRDCHRELLELADTVTEMRPTKHAFDAGDKGPARH